MEIRYGNILTYEEKYICQVVNSLGIMGAGLALQIRKVYPKVYEIYSKKDLKLGSAFGVDCGKHTILNVVAQKEIGRAYKPLNYQALKIGLNVLDENIEGKVAFPRLGCGLAGGDWHKVYNMLTELKNIQPIIYELNDEVPY